MPWGLVQFARSIEYTLVYNLSCFLTVVVSKIISKGLNLVTFFVLNKWDHIYHCLFLPEGWTYFLATTFKLLTAVWFFFTRSYWWITQFLLPSNYQLQTGMAIGRICKAFFCGLVYNSEIGDTSITMIFYYSTWCQSSIYPFELHSPKAYHNTVARLIWVL